MSNKLFNKYDNQVAVNLRHYIAIKNISMENLATELGITKQQIQKYESGKDRISSGRLKQISLFLGVPLNNFYDEPDMRISEEHRLSSIVMVREFSTIEDKDIIMVIRTLINKFKKG